MQIGREGIFDWLIGGQLIGMAGQNQLSPFAILDTNGDPILDTNGGYILDTNGTTKP